MKALKTMSLMLIMLVFAFGIGDSTVAFAADGDDEITITRETEIDISYFSGNENLFSVLLSIVNAERKLEGEPRAVSTFKAGYFDEKISLNLNNNDPLNMIGEAQINAHPNKKITSLSGLESLYFGALKELKLDNNNIRTITDEELNRAPNLNKLSMKNNRIENIEKFANNKVYYLDLSGNNIQEIDLSQIEKSDGVYYDADKAYVNLDYNRIADIEDIKLPDLSIVAMDLFLVCNNFMTAIPSDFGGHNVRLMVQGYKPDGTIEAGATLRLVQDGITVLSAKLFYQAESVFYDAANPDAAITSSNTNGILTFVPGKVILKFYEDDVVIALGVFAERVLDVKPAKPEFVVLDSDNRDLSISNRYGDQIKIVASSSEGATIWAKQQSADSYVVGNEVTLVSTGTYKVSFVSVYDGLTSDETSFNVTLYNSAALMWLLIGVVVLIVVIIAIVFIVRWYRAGGIVAPLTEKEQNRSERPRR